MANRTIERIESQENNTKTLRLTKAGRESILRGARQGIKDIEEGRYEEYDEHGLRNLAKKLVANSAKKLPHVSKAK
jgi:hypothetical protein